MLLACEANPATAEANRIARLGAEGFGLELDLEDIEGWMGDNDTLVIPTATDENGNPLLDDMV